jgi:hypothetical protein
VDPRAGLDDLEKIPTPRLSSLQPVAIPTALSRLPLEGPYRNLNRFINHPQYVAKEVSYRFK